MCIVALRLTFFSLFSFAKYLELLIYSPALCTLSPRLCEHTTPPPSPWPADDSPPRSRFNIIRHFVCAGSKLEIKFRVSLAPALFELRVPRLQVMRGRFGDSGAQRVSFANVRRNSTDRKSFESIEEKRILRTEIKRWFESISDHMDKLVSIISFSTDYYRKKKLIKPSGRVFCS